MNKKSLRDASIDWLKTIGTLCLFLAHVEAPFWVKEIRGFDVPLMIFVSGLLAAGSYSRSSSDGQYIFKRINRLIIPTWIFLCFFYLCMFCVGKLPDYATIIKSFLFQRDGGIAGYTWIIWVYIICAILTPMLIKLNINSFSICTIVIIWITYEIMIEFSNLESIRILYYTFFTIIPFGILLLCSIKLRAENKTKLTLTYIILFISHCAYALVLFFLKSKYVSINEYKYPARFYYLSYGLSVAIILLCIFRTKCFEKKRIFIIEFVSKHSLWIYLWHIFIISILKYVMTIDNWIINYLVLVISSIGITYIQDVIVKSIQRKRDFMFLQYFVG